VFLRGTTLKFLQYDLGSRKSGEIVEVTLSSGANVRLMTSSEFSNYKNGKKHRFIGGLAKRSPVRLQITSSGHWYVVVDMQGLKGSTKASVRILPGMLPEIQERPLSEIPSLVRENIPSPIESGGETHDVFISHASEDKDDFVRPLANALIQQGLNVWYDEMTLRIGDSLRQKIDKGLANSKVGLVVLSPSFIKKGWTNYELDGIITKTVSGEQVLLPIWHNITKQQVVDFSPSLADKMALSTATHTIEEIAQEIAYLLQLKNLELQPIVNLGYLPSVVCRTRDSSKLEKLVIRNFGAIHEIELELKQTTVFIGPQSSGKSTIAKLIDIFRNPLFLLLFDDLSQQEISTKNYLSFFEHHNLQNFFNEQTKLEYSCDEYRFSYAAGEFKLIFLQEEPENQNLKLLRVMDLKQPRIIQPLYIPAERSFISMASGAFLSLINNDVPIPKNILEFGAAFERARRQFQQLPIDFLNVVYQYENNQDRVLLDSEKSIKLTESASGLQTAIPLIAVIEANYDGVPRTFVIEEPELNLFPETQRDLVYYLIAKATFIHENQEGNELVITTHSPYILAAINLCLFAQRVAQKRPDKIKEIQVIVPQFSWLNPNQFCAYYVGEGTAKTIFNPKTGMISESILDEASEMIGSDFDELMEIYQKNPDETTT